MVRTVNVYFDALKGCLLLTKYSARKWPTLVSNITYQLEILLFLNLSLSKNCVLRSYSKQYDVCLFLFFMVMLQFIALPAVHAPSYFLLNRMLNIYIFLKEGCWIKSSILSIDNNYNKLTTLCLRLLLQYNAWSHKQGPQAAAGIFYWVLMLLYMVTNTYPRTPILSQYHRTCSFASFSSLLCIQMSFIWS